MECPIGAVRDRICQDSTERERADGVQDEQQGPQGAMGYHHRSCPVSGEEEVEIRKWFTRILKGVGIVVGVLAVLVMGLVVFVQLTWNRPVSRPVPEMTAPNDAETVARGEYPV